MYVVAVITDDNVRVSGGFLTSAAAQEFADKVNKRISEEEDAQLAEYYAHRNSEELVPHIPAWAHVRYVHQKRVKEATRFAVTGNAAAAS